MAAALSSTLDYHKILESAMNAGWLGLKKLSDKNYGRFVSAVMLFRASDNALHVEVGRGLVRTDEGRIIPGEEGIIGQTLKLCRPMILNANAKKDPELSNFVAFQSVRSILCIPLRAGFENYGVMVYGSERPNIFTDEHTELLTAVGTQATVALQNAVLYLNLLKERDKIVEVEEEARKKLARDLHDGPTQNVAAIAMRMSIIYKMLERTPDEVPAELKKIEEIARNTTKEIRSMLFTLRPLVLENQGLTAALNQLAEKMQETYSQAVKVWVASDAESVLDMHHQGTIFYIIEEAVGNARKHAQAPVINVSVARQEEVVIVTIADNGVGFDAKAAEENSKSRGGHLGMINLYERTELLGGSLRIDSTVGKGTNITVVIPVKSGPNGTQGKRVSKQLSTAEMTKLEAAVQRMWVGQHDNY
jgi:signal transduction histidine kinase